MTATTAPTRPPVAAAHDVLRRWDPRAALRRWDVLAAVAVTVLALLLRWWRHDVTYDLFVDEFVYERLGSSVTSGWLPRLGGETFHLHPPGYFYLLAGWERLAGLAPGGDPVQRVFTARGLNVVLGAVTAGLATFLVARWSPLWGSLAGLVVAVEPFVVRQNGRVLLDTAVVFWLFAALVLLRPPRGGVRRDVSPRWRVVAGGLALGLAVLTKDKSVVFTLLPLAALWWLRPAQRTWVPTAFCVGLLPYAVYTLAVVAAGDGAAWAQAKFGGLLRAVGAQVTTGFNAPGAPSLLEQVLRQLADFGATYLLLATGAVAAAALLRSAADELFLLALVHVGAFAMLAYSAVAGTLEEHFLYYLLVPSVATLFTAAGATATLPRRADASHRRAGASRGADLLVRARSALRWVPVRGGALLLLAGVVLAADVATYVRWHVEPDDGFVRVRQYLAENVPDGTGVVITQGTSEFAFGDRWRVGPFTGDLQRIDEDARYLVVPWREVQQGYTYVSEPTVRDLVAEGELVLSVRSRSYGEVDLYRLPLPDVP